MTDAPEPYPYAGEDALGGSYSTSVPASDLQQIIGEHLHVKQRVELSRAYRTLREAFGADASNAAVNQSLQGSGGDLSDRQLSLAIDISKKTAWESSLVPHLDDLPFQYIGDGSQSALKIMLALERTAEESQVVLVEEPENRLSPASLNALVHRLSEKCVGKRILVSTHSSFVLNKLGLDHLVLRRDGASTRLCALPPDTLDDFKKLFGYDTLRLVRAPRRQHLADVEPARLRSGAAGHRGAPAASRPGPFSVRCSPVGRAPIDRLHFLSPRTRADPGADQARGAASLRTMRLTSLDPTRRRLWGGDSLVLGPRTRRRLALQLPAASARSRSA